MYLYVTSDRIGIQTGGGAVTLHESEALKSLGQTIVCSVPTREGESVFGPDDRLHDELLHSDILPKIQLSHFYAGTWTRTIQLLQGRGCRVAYTAAAHDVSASRCEHEQLGIAFDHPHLTDPVLWERYVGGYLAADVLVCPSRHSLAVMRGFGYAGRAEVVPHGVGQPGTARPAPQVFTVGYLGAYGPDKGVRYLLEAWKRLDYRDALLVLAGRDSASHWVSHLISRFGGGNIARLGWVPSVSDFYNSISIYVQPSVTEGFGIEVLEAMAHKRLVLCSRGAGAHDLLVDDHLRELSVSAEKTHYGISVPAGNVRDWTGAIAHARMLMPTKIHEHTVSAAHSRALDLTWDKVREMYVNVWKSML